ncbi:MAG: hypothetical protein K0U98_14640 [Deltaproteobacteria bacterium]|nr:hypothetical protein [Deltaproteobacteria bacterium]
MEAGQVSAFGDRVVLLVIPPAGQQFIRVYEPSSGTIRDLGEIPSSLAPLASNDRYLAFRPRPFSNNVLLHDWDDNETTLVVESEACRSPLLLTSTHVVLQSCEWGVGVDLNGNGSTDDAVPAAFPLEGGAPIYSSGSSGRSTQNKRWLAAGDRYVASGEISGGDINVLDPISGTTTEYDSKMPSRGLILPVDDRFLFGIPERSEDRDINGDGDALDDVYGLLDPELAFIIEIPWAYNQESNGVETDFLATARGPVAVLPATFGSQPGLPNDGAYLLTLEVTPGCSGVTIDPIP